MRKEKRNVSFHYGEACNKSPSTHLSFLVFLGEQPRIVHPNGWCSAFRTAQRIPPWSTSIHLILRFCSMQKLFRKLGIKRRRSNVLDSYCREISRVAAGKRKNSIRKKIVFLSLCFLLSSQSQDMCGVRVKSWDAEFFEIRDLCFFFAFVWFVLRKFDMLCRVGLVVVKYRTRNSLRFVSEEEEEKEERTIGKFLSLRKICWRGIMVFRKFKLFPINFSMFSSYVGLQYEIIHLR